MKHKPWSASHQLSSDDELINEFTTFLQDPKCPTSVKLSFERAKLKHQQMTRNFQEVISPDQEHSNPVSPDDHDTIEVLATMNGFFRMWGDWKESIDQHYCSSDKNNLQKQQ
jgi:hypothetical protein